MLSRKTHKKANRILEYYFSSPFEELRKSNECTIHTKNFQKLVLEIYKCINKENPLLYRKCSTKSVQCDLRSKNLLMLSQTNTIRC